MEWASVPFGPASLNWSSRIEVREMMTFTNDKMAPPTFCELLYQVVPEEYHADVVFSYGGKHMRPGAERNLGLASWHFPSPRVYLNLESIAFHGRLEEHACRSAAVWHHLLRVALHEFGHLADDGDATGYGQDLQIRQACERRADAWADERLEAILDWDKRLCQPPSLGLIDVVWRRERREAKALHDEFEPRYSHWLDYRCWKSGGQISVGQMARHVFGSVARVIDDDERRRVSQKRRHLVHRYGDDLAVNYRDKAGRLHRFWTWGDVGIIAQRIRGTA
jgi:hypothetical protein